MTASIIHSYTLIVQDNTITILSYVSTIPTFPWFAVLKGCRYTGFMPENIHIREAEAGDETGITQVHIASWRSTYQGIVSDDTLANLDAERREKMWREMLTNPESSNFAFVAETGMGEVVGFASGGPESSGEEDFDGELYAIYILEEFQRQGIGRRLTQAIIRRLIDDGYYSMLLWVLKDNQGSRKFYEKMGGELVGEKQYEIGGELLDAVGYGWKDIKSK